MCLGVYLVSDSTLPETKRDKSHPAFGAARLKRKETFLNRLPGANAYYLGSYQGCGCGFISDDAKDRESRASRAQLSSYVANALRHQSPVLLFAAWAGDEHKQAALVKLPISDLLSYPWEKTWDGPQIIEVMDSPA
jgi:hypothetical protein